jgi:hypothetical protein
MKPTPPINPSQHDAARSFPLTDYNFQTTAEAPTSSSAATAATKAPAFHKLSTEVFGVKTTADFFAELFLFIVVSGTVAWPVVSAMHAITRMVRNY